MTTPASALVVSCCALLLPGMVQPQKPPVVAPPQQGQPAVAEGDGTVGQHNAPIATTAITRLKTGGRNDWFDRTRLQLGDHLNKELVKGVFRFKNPHAVPVEWKAFTGSCQCAKALIRVGERKYVMTKNPNPKEHTSHGLEQVEVKDGAEVRTTVASITVGPEESGEVEVHMEMGGFEGIRDATLQFATSDQKFPLMLLKWEAMGVKLFNIRPADFFMNDMKWEDEKVFRFTVTSPVKKDFKLLDHEPLPPYVKVNKKPVTLPDGTPAWEVSGTFGPKADPGSGGASIKFMTDLDNKVVTMNVMANVLGPITVTPGTFIPLGLIRRTVGAERKVTITPNGDFKLAIDKIELQQLTIDKDYLEVAHVQDGKSLVISLRVLPDAAPDKRVLVVRGKMLVHLNHPAVKVKDFSFNGMLR